MEDQASYCIEILRPKTVPEGLIALGTIANVSETQLKLQIAGGIICLVDRYNVSKPYSDLIGQRTTTNKNHSLSQMFKIGQRYVCKITEKRARKGYADAQDIIATLDPSSIQEDNLPRAFFAIPEVPLQCAVRSIEDHGYQMDVGFQNITGFMTFDEASEYNEGKRLLIGQVVRCCLKKSLSSSDDDQFRVVHLTTKKSKFTKEKVTECALTERSILPGSSAFLTVMKVLKDGLAVNFMNEFIGFVSRNHLIDPWKDPKESYKISDQFDCKVLYFNHITKNFSLSIRKPAKFKKTLSHFIENYHVGQVLDTASVISIDGKKSVNFKIDGNYRAVSNVRDALENDLDTMSPDEIHLALDAAFPEGSTHKCRIKSINLADLVLVVSLKKEFLDLPCVSVDELKSADFVEATVKKHVKDGIVVTFGLNLRAIILNADLHDYDSAHSNKRYPIGKPINCRVLKVDFEKHPPRVYLTNKEILMDPKLTIIDSYDKSWKGKSTQATIIKIKPDGLIVELFNNVKGYIPRRFLSSVPIANVGDLFKIGQVTPCTVYRVNEARQSLLLGVVPLKTIFEMKKEKQDKKLVDKTKKLVDKTKTVVNEKALAAALSKARKRPTTEITVAFEESDKEDTDAENRPTGKTEQAAVGPPTKSRRLRSEEARIREERLREAEKNLLDPDRPPQSIPDFERLLLKTPNAADAWIRYSKFFLDNVETEKARIICRRALRTINFRLEKEKLKIWLHLIRIEAKYGGVEKLKETIEEAAQTNDRLKLYQATVKVLTSCGELDEAERLLELMQRSNGKSAEFWIEYIRFKMEDRKDLNEARALFDKACKNLVKSDLVNLKSRFAQFEFKFGDVERGRTIFENLLSDNPKRTDLWKVYEGMIRKFGTRQISTTEVRQQNEDTLQRVAESIALVSKKARKKGGSKAVAAAVAGE